MKTESIISDTRVQRSLRSRFNPIRHLTPESLSRQLDEFHAGYLQSVTRTWEAIERRDDIIQGVVSKRKKAAARLEWEILTTRDDAEAEKHRDALLAFYNQITATSAIDQNISGGISLLIEQMMDAVGKRYAVHEIIWQPQGGGRLAATFRMAPLWFFENRSGKLRFLADESSYTGLALQPGAWMTTVGDGIMEATSVAYMFKHLPLRDWLIYSERNGMPGVRGVTEAAPGSREWDLAREAVAAFGSEFSALMNHGTTIEPIDLTSRGPLPYPALVERMDRAIIALWRGSDLGTISSNNAVGASVQKSETTVLEAQDARMISETLNAQVDRYVIQYLFGNATPRAYINIRATEPQDEMRDLKIYRELYEMGAAIPTDHLFERFGIPKPLEGDAVLAKQ